MSEIYTSGKVFMCFEYWRFCLHFIWRSFMVQCLAFDNILCSSILNLLKFIDFQKLVTCRISFQINRSCRPNSMVNNWIEIKQSDFRKKISYIHLPINLRRSFSFFNFWYSQEYCALIKYFYMVNIYIYDLWNFLKFDFEISLTRNDDDRYTTRTV